MYTVEGLGKIYKVHRESSLPFGTLFDNISQQENMIVATPSFTKNLPVRRGAEGPQPVMGAS